MKKFIVFAAFAAFSVASFAASADDLRVGYVDVQKILNESKAGKRAQAELEKAITQRRDALVKEEQELKKLQEAFEKDKLLLAETQKQARQKEFQDKLEHYQKAAAEMKRELAQKERELSAKAEVDIRAIIKELAQAEKLTLVFETSTMPVLYAIEGPDLTDKVMKKYDAKNGG